MNIMKKSELLLCVALAIAGSACSKEPDIRDDDASDAVRFSTNISLTKVSDTRWESEDRVGIFMTNTDNQLISDECSNRKYIPASDNNLTPDGAVNTLYFPKDGSGVNFHAYCPYAELDGTIFGIDLSDQSNQSSVDFVYAANRDGKNKNDSDVLLSFEHILSKVVLEVSMADGTEAGNLSCTIYGMNTKADFNLLKGELGEYDGVQAIVPFRQGTRFEAILLPSALTESNYIEFKSGDETYRWNIVDDISELTGGNKYIWQISLTPEAAVPAGTKGVISDWVCTSGETSIGTTPTITYAIGDYWPNPDISAGGHAEGIVFTVSADGKHGKILSLVESSGLKWNTTGGKDETLDADDGAVNWNIIKSKDASFTNYPAFAWCASLGDGWYIPAINELLAVRTAWGATIEEKEAFNKRISDVGGIPLKMTAMVGGSAKSAYYYSSTEKESAANKALSLSFNSTSGASDGIKKSSDSQANLIFRAIKKF